MSETITPTIAVTASYALTKTGQKAALLAGKNAAEKQTITGEIPADLLGMCRIKEDGTVVADYTQNVGIHENGAVSDSWSGWSSYHTAQDAPADSVVELLSRIRDGVAAKVAEVSAAWEQKKERGRLQDEERAAERAAKLAEAARIMAADPLAIPPLDYEIMQRDYPKTAEIRRRQKAKADADKRAAEELAAAKQAAARAWLATYGAADQVERFDAGLLGEDELKTTMADYTLAALSNYPRYKNMGESEVREKVDEEYEGYKVQFRSGKPEQLTREQWLAIKAMRAACPEATIEPRLHEATVDHEDVPWGLVERMGVLATIEVAGVEVRREYAL